MDAHAAAALFAESNGLQPLAFRPVGSRDDAETLCRLPESQTKLALLRVVRIGAATWAVRVHWDVAAQSPTGMATLRAAILSFHGDAAVAPVAVAVTVNIPWKQGAVSVPCPAGWQPMEPAEDGAIQLRPLAGMEACLRVRTSPPTTSQPAIFTSWRMELENAGFQVFGAPITRLPGSPTSNVLLKAEKNGKLFEAPAALSEFLEGSVLLSFLSPSWRSSPETSALTQRAFADFALAIEDALRRA